MTFCPLILCKSQTCADLGCLGQAKQPLQPNILPPIILHQLQHQSLTCEPTESVLFRSGLRIDLASSIQFAFFEFGWLYVIKCYIYRIYIYIWLVVYLPSEKYSSVGMMKFPIYGKIKHVPNHQPDIIYVYIYTIPLTILILTWGAPAYKKSFMKWEFHGDACL